MKPRNILKAAVLLALTSSAMADATIDVTGATAFRATTLQAIYNAYASVANAITNSVFNTFNVAYDFTGNNSATMIKANVVTFKGSYPGITGTTVIRCSFNGSVEGLKAIATTNEPASFLTAAAVTNSGTFQGGTTTPTESVRPKFAFSDVLQANTPVTNSLNPESPAVGVVTFMPIANNGAPTDLSNLTQQQLRQLVNAGIQPLSLFTGKTNDARNVYMVGRNDGSGTRTDYLLESGYGAANTVSQYVPLFSTNGTNTSSGTNAYGVTNPGQIKALVLVPANGQGSGIVSNTVFASGTNKITLNTNSPNYRYVYSGNIITGTGIASGTKIDALATNGATNGVITLSKNTTGAGTNKVTINGAVPYNTGSTNYASTIWGNSAAGNGGYSSGSGIATLFTYRSTNVSLWDPASSSVTASNQNVVLVTYLSTSDARTAIATNTIARGLSYNGVAITPIATSGSYKSSGFSQADYDKVTTGAYSAWSFQNLYYQGTLTTDLETFYNTLTGTNTGSITATLGSTANGIPTTDMLVSRPDDGGPITGSLY